MLRDLLILARQESAHRHHHYLGVEHLLLALLHAPGAVAQRALEGQGVAPSTALAALEAHLAPGDPLRAWAGVPLTPRATMVLSIAQDIALEAGRAEATPHDVLLALLEEGESLALRALAVAGVRAEALAAALRDTPPAPHEPLAAAVTMAASLMLRDDHLQALRAQFPSRARLHVTHAVPVEAEADDNDRLLVTLELRDGDAPPVQHTLTLPR